jgi:AcrR family transcriptional regulator
MSTQARTEPPRRGRPSAGAREAIMAATLDLLRADGLARLTTREVARRAGVSEASVFYHFGDKVGLLQEAMISGLGPLKALDPEVLSGQADRPPLQVLTDIGLALEAFFDQAMPVFSTMQSDAKLRAAFAARLTEGDRGPHRGVQLVGGYLQALKRAGRGHLDADGDALALMLVGSAFLRAWQGYLAGPATKNPLPSTQQTVRALAALTGLASAPPQTESAGEPPVEVPVKQHQRASGASSGGGHPRGGGPTGRRSVGRARDG